MLLTDMLALVCWRGELALKNKDTSAEFRFKTLEVKLTPTKLSC
jgi:hypothetical protein